MTAVEAEGYESQVVAVQGGYTDYSQDADGRIVPAAIDFLTTNGDGTVWGFGFSPSAYLTVGQGNEYFAARTWISAPWAIGTVMILCPICFMDDDDEEDDDDYDEYRFFNDDDKDINYAEAIGEWINAFSAGVSIIEQIPIGDSFRIGIEQYISRSRWIIPRDDSLDASIEMGVGAYINVKFKKFALGADFHYGILDYDPERRRIAAAINFSYYKPPDEK